MELCTSACALGLYSYGNPIPRAGLFRDFHSLVVGWFEAHGCPPNWVGAEGATYSGEYVRTDGDTHRRLIQTCFQDVSVLSMATAPPASREPSYDAFASASLSFVHAGGELLLCWVVNERFVGFGSPEFESALCGLAGLAGWDFGYAFAADASRQPDFHILGLDNGRLSPAEQDALNRWYAAPPEERVTRLRAVYPFNILNRQQLASILTREAPSRNPLMRAFPRERRQAERTLGDFIRDERHSSLEPLSGDLSLWKVRDAAAIARISGQLAGSDILIASQ